MKFLISTLAEYQSDFWLQVGMRLQQAGHAVSYLSFDDRSTEMLREGGFKVYSYSETSLPSGVFDEHSAIQFLNNLGIADLNFWMGHERFAFGMRDTFAMLTKLICSYRLAQEAIRDLMQTEGSGILLQELGGFLSVIGAYFAAKQNGIDNYFLEPSFFRGRLFFIRNSFGAKRVNDLDGEPAPGALQDYISKTLQAKAIVVPKKDKHQYTTAFKKVVNSKNLKRLCQKLVDKFVLKKHQEFGHIGWHVKTHIKMILRGIRVKRYYSHLQACGRFVYFPLHVPGDMALTLRAPHLLDQMALIDFLCRSVPPGMQVVIKEHPAMVGAISSSRLLELIARYDNLRVLFPKTNNFDVLGQAQLVVSINSKSGAEAMLLGKKVIVLGETFYTHCPLVCRTTDIQTLPSVIAAQLSTNNVPSRVDIERYFSSVWKQSLPGELYTLDAAEIDVFAESVLSYFQGPGHGQ